MTNAASETVNLGRAHAHCLAIVDDDTAVRDSMRSLLESYGFQVREFASAAALLGTSCQFCCLIVDLHMPQTDGLQLLEVLRLSGIETPAILMIDKEEPVLLPRIRALRACDKLAKPIPETMLIRSIGRACANERA